jgi:3-deoxy-manno-octulosonate cytidylyltransferase (CMP-KDO synthetase)
VRLVCIIPARRGSSRLPDKPLRLLRGEPLIRVVARRALALDLGAPVVVASDDERVLEQVSALAVQPLLTARTHRSGTERVAEVAARPEFAGSDVILNLQGDEPFVPRAAALGAVERVRDGDDIGTAAQPLDAAEWRNPNRVKVEIDGHGRACRFYRTPAPPACNAHAPTFHHLGVYAYAPATLRRWVTASPTPEEMAESLEQLRPLALGLTIGVATVPETVAHGIDTEDDLRMAEALL